MRPSQANREMQRRMSICETLDRVLNKGVVVRGELVLCVADVDLVYVGVNVLLSSVETLRESRAVSHLERGHAMGQRTGQAF